MTMVSDTFNRADGALGTATSGQAWSVLAGTCTVKSNRGFANNSGRAIAVLDAGNGDATVQADTGNGGGYAIYFRVSDVSNWWRLAVNYYSYSYVTGSHLVTYCNYANGTTDTYASYSGYAAACPASQPGTGSPQSGGHVETAYDYGTAYAYQLVLQKCVGGTVTTISSIDITSPTWIRAVLSGNSVQTYCSSTGAAVQHNISDSFNATATKHGIGYYESTTYGNSDGLDNFAIAPVNRAPATPGVPSISPSAVDTAATISWASATDPDGDPVTYDVEFSGNNGSSWSVIATGVGGTSTTYNFSATAETTTAKVRVRAKDTAGLYGPYATQVGTFTISHVATVPIWTGAWTPKPVYRWDGTQWVAVTTGKVQRWNGSAWVNT